MVLELVLVNKQIDAGYGSLLLVFENMQQKQAMEHQIRKEFAEHGGNVQRKWEVGIYE